MFQIINQNWIKLLGSIKVGGMVARSKVNRRIHR